MSIQREMNVETPDGIAGLLKRVARMAEASGAFSDVSSEDGAVVCRFIDEEVDAEFRLDWTEGGLEVSMMTPDRWLSQSVEATLVNSGDSLEDLIDEEMVELGCDAGPLSMKHFRDRQMRYVFVSPVPITDRESGSDAAAETAFACLCGYERAFAELGDFAPGDE